MTRDPAEADRALKQGRAAHQAGRLNEAEQFFRAALSTDPERIEALHLLGVVLAQSGRAAEGESCIAQAIARDPFQPMLHIHRGIALGTMGRGEDAVASFDRALTLAPDHIGAIFNRGLALLGLKRAAEAAESFSRAIALKPGFSEAYFNRARARMALDQAEQAVTDFDRVILLAPASAQAFHGRALALLHLGRLERALADSDRATALKPDMAELFVMRGDILGALRRPMDAVGAYSRAIGLRPDLTAAFYNRGNSLFLLRRIEAALADYEQAIALEPDFVEAYLNRANALAELGRLSEALAGYEKAIALDPEYAKAYRDRGDTLAAQSRNAEALADYRQARRLDGGMNYLSGAILRAKMQLCDWSDFEGECAHVLGNVAGETILEAPFVLLSIPSLSHQQRRCAERHIRHSLPAAAQPLWRGERYRHAKIRLAYLTGALRDHPTTTLMGGLFERHDRTRFETIALSLSLDDGSAERRRMQSAFDEFIDLSRTDDRDAAALIRRREVDILVDLDGFIEAARTGILARRAAPVQVNYLGYAGTMGASYVDYILADRVLIEEADQNHYAEKIAWLPDSYQPNTARAEPAVALTREACCLPGQGFVFCCLNNSNKITPDIFELWMRLLKQVEGSVLWLLVADGTARSNLSREAERLGIGAQRLVFADYCGQGEHLARLRLADLFLDTRYYNAHTTASDALWMGLPLVTCRGGTFAGRVAASLLKAAGVPELVTEGLEAYEALALRLAREPALLTSFRARLEQNRATSALFDVERFRRNLEAAYVRMWETAERGEPAQSFLIGG
jgi:predicted O-linked N-acetylglucosamine transferase (SPINDLY family)